MKKFLVYSLIILTVIGIFSPVSGLRAQTTDPLGTCNYPPGITGPGGATVSSEQMTQSQCVGTGGAGGVSWTPNPFGVCIINGQRNENWQQQNCIENNGVWSGYYNLLAPLPCSTPGSNGCDANGKLVSFDPTQKNNIGAYLNLMIRIFIGICAVLSVVMIVMGGVEYMTSELISSKEAGKERITGAIFGLLLALAAWTLLNQINPDILKTDLSSLAGVTVNVNITNFQIASSGPQSRYGTAIAIDFNSQAYPAAAAAQASTGVDPALVLAIFNQETASGASTGACFPANANMTAADQAALASIVGPDNVATTHVSCALSSGHGGAIGLTQFLPTTWNQYRDQGKTALGHDPDPWNTQDALMMTAIFLKNNANKIPGDTTGACAYFGSCSSGGVNYGAQVAAQTAALQKQIAQAKANGTIKS